MTDPMTREALARIFNTQALANMGRTPLSDREWAIIWGGWQERSHPDLEIIDAILAAFPAESAEKAKVWCITHQHEHIATVPRFTFMCKSCGFGAWHKPSASEHEAQLPDHETYEVEHVMAPLAARTPTPASTDARETLADIIAQFAVQNNPHGLSIGIDMAHELSDAILAAFPTLPVTRDDAKAEAWDEAQAAINAHYSIAGGGPANPYRATSQKGDGQ